MVQSIHKTVSQIEQLNRENPSPPRLCGNASRPEMMAELLKLVHDIRRRASTEGSCQAATLELVSQLYQQVTG